ncbi:MAG: L-histidine N(alpha)-methyltransferase [Gloeomargaritaceae cyanobacterium C42_A2020_066]|nr:L-histidine N(alpha)-methyltransferase [Gloeomargaritaceae cyanobacterium C42_A2020_066]
MITASRSLCPAPMLPPSFPSDVANRYQTLHLTQWVDDGHDVKAGLLATPRTLPCRYFYDDLGSHLFEAICVLPEYYLTRTERQILQDCAPEIAALTGPCQLVELGSGSSRKTRLLLDAYSSFDPPFEYLPVDVSAGMLQSSAQELLQDYPKLQVTGLVATYEQALAHLPPVPAGRGRLLIFLGSTIGNLAPQDCEAFLTRISPVLGEQDYFLLGVDLQKSVEILEAAYNDSQGVTAAFNLNLLRHLNRRFEGNFQLEQFEHWAFYNTQEHQIEMHLRSCCDQRVQLNWLALEFKVGAGETLRTEVSRKFSLDRFLPQLARQGLQPVRTWTDPGQGFALILCRGAAQVS